MFNFTPVANRRLPASELRAKIVDVLDAQRYLRPSAIAKRVFGADVRRSQIGRVSRCLRGLHQRREIARASTRPEYPMYRSL